jgi:hypothetical protein
MAQVRELELLVERMEKLLETRGGGDAIDSMLSREARTTQTTPLRNHPAVERFRQEMRDGLIRLDTAQQLLGLVRMVLESAVAA